MKTVFIVNPHAGKKKNIQAFIERIKNASVKCGKSVEIYKTVAVQDATRFVKKYYQENGRARFIACGGDGTVNEVINGVMECADCEVGVVPIGTGNDFCRNFDCDFFSLQAQIDGCSEKCDVISYSTVVNGKEKNGYCINMFNIGFDCNVADLTNKIKEKTFIGGSFAYFASILINLIKKKGTSLKIELDGEEKHSGRLLLTSLANGCYCGGGIKSNPFACAWDGYINVNIIKNVSRMRFISLLPSYIKGTVFKRKGVEKILVSGKCTKVAITPVNGNIRICIDGEITDAGKTEFKIVHNGVNFVVPTLPVKEPVIV